MKLIAPVNSLNELNSKARKDIRYKKLAITAANNLGGNVKNDSLDDAIRVLRDNIMETDEDGVMEEINFCRDLIDDNE